MSLPNTFFEKGIYTQTYSGERCKCEFIQEQKRVFIITISSGQTKMFEKMSWGDW